MQCVWRGAILSLPFLSSLPLYTPRWSWARQCLAFAFYKVGKHSSLSNTPWLLFLQA